MKRVLKYLKKSGLILLFLLITLSLTSVLQAQHLYSTDGLNSIEVNTTKGAFTLHLPANVYKGDVVSGTVVKEPTGKNPKQLAKSSAYLADCRIIIEERTYDVSGKLSSIQIPVNLEGEQLNISVIDREGINIGTSSIPVLGDELPVYGNEPFVVAIPPIIKQDIPTQLAGPFDGILDNTKVLIGAQEATMIAESPRELFIRHNMVDPGMNDIIITEGDDQFKEEIRIIRLDASVSKVKLTRGESTELNIQVSGLIELSHDLAVEIDNQSPSIIQLPEGNQQTIEIQHEDISSAGVWTTTVSGNSINPGDFYIDIDIPLPPLTRIVPVFPVHTIIKEVPFEFVWNPVNLPGNSTFDFKIWSFPDRIPEPLDEIGGIAPLFEKTNVVNHTVVYPIEFNGFKLEDKEKYHWKVETLTPNGIINSSPISSFGVDIGPVAPEDNRPGEGDPCEDPEYVKKEEAQCADIVWLEVTVPLNTIQLDFDNFKDDWKDYFRMLNSTMTQFDLQLSMVKYWVGVGEEIDQQAQQVQKLAGLVKKGIGKGVKAYKEGGEEVMKEMGKEFAEDKVKEFEQWAVNSVSRTAGALYDLEDLAIRRIGLGIAKGMTGVYPDKMADHFRRQLQLSTTQLMGWVDNRYNYGALPPHPTLQQGINGMCRMLNQLDQIEKDFEKAVEAAGFICIECEIPRHLLEDMARLRNDIEAHIRMFGDTIDQVRQRLLEARAIIRNKDAYEDVSRLGSAQGNIKKWTEEIDRVMNDSKTQFEDALRTRKQG